MEKSSARRSTRRKPLSDVSNSLKHSRVPVKQKQQAPPGDDAVLHRLVLSHTRLAKLVSEVDELVAQAFERGITSKTVSTDVDSFADCLSNMCAGLKPWISKFKKVFADPSIESNNQFAQSIGEVLADTVEECPLVGCSKDGETNLIVSPSPLVSWRPGACTIECGKQLFLLTPLPKSKAASSKLKTATAGLSTTTVHVHDELPKAVVMAKNSNNLGCLLTEDGEVLEKKHESPVTRSVIKTGDISRTGPRYLLTPCLKSSLKSGVPLDSISEAFRELTTNNKDTTDSPNASGMVGIESSCNNILEHLESKRTDPCFASQGMPTYDTFEIDGSLEWFLSPPKTCVPLEPPGLAGKNVKMVESTPMPNGLESTVHKGRKGETTLKRELWMRFEAVSGPKLGLGASVNQTIKGFLDMLEEVSSDAPCGH